jgi:hypothetical protein
MRSFVSASAILVSAVCVLAGCGAPQKPIARPEAPRAYRDQSGRVVATKRFGSECESCTKVPSARWSSEDDRDQGKPEYFCPADGTVVDVEVSGDDVVERIGNVLVVTAASGQYCCTVAPDCITGLHAWDVNPLCIGRMACRPVLYVGGRK